MIAATEAKLGVRFPEALRDIWKTCNCNELRGGWRLFPIFDPANPRKTCGSITYENLKGVWCREAMSDGLLSIADNGTGNQLVLKVSAGVAGADILHWHHETHKLTRWKPGMASIQANAHASRETVSRLHNRFGQAHERSDSGSGTG